MQGLDVGLRIRFHKGALVLAFQTYYSVEISVKLRLVVLGYSVEPFLPEGSEDVETSLCMG